CDSADRLSPGPLQMIVELRILELRQIQLCRVLHQLDAHRVGEEIAEQAFDQGRGAGENFAGQYDQQLQREVAPDLVEISLPVPRCNHGVEYQLADPEGRDGNDRPDHAQDDDGCCVPAVRTPNEPEQ